MIETTSLSVNSSSINSVLSNQMKQTGDTSEKSTQTSSVMSDSSYYTDVVDISEDAQSTASGLVQASGAIAASSNPISGATSSADSSAVSPPTTSTDRSKGASSAATSSNESASATASKAATSSSSTTDLSSDTDYQLKQLLVNKQISQVQYNAEMNRRERATGKEKVLQESTSASMVDKTNSANTTITTSLSNSTDSD